MNIRTTTILGIVFSGTLLAQTTSTSDCDGAVQLCGGIYTETNAPTGTGNVYEFTGSCNQNLESESTWYTFTVQNPGNLSFVLDPANDADDYDWGMFNITNGGCAGINSQDGTSPEVECNSYGLFGSNGQTGISTANGGTGTSNGPGDLNGPPFNADLPVQVGQTYAVVVMNWTGSTSGYSIDFTQSTASIYDENPPSIVSVTPDCANHNFLVTFSETIVTSTVDSTDFTLTSPSGVVFQFDSVEPGNPLAPAQSGYTLVLDGMITEGGLYTFTVTSVSGNVEDLCGNIVVDTTFTVPVTAPMSFNVVATTACNGAGGSLQANYFSGGVPPISFYLDGSSIPGGTASGLEPGDYGLTVVDSVNCQFNETVTIPDHAIDVQIPPFQDSLSCSNKTVTIEGLHVVPDQSAQYLWAAETAAGIDSSFSNTSAPTVTQPGTYFVLATDPVSGCTDTDSVVITSTSFSSVDMGTLTLPTVVSPNGDGKNDVWRPFLPADPGIDLTSLLDTYDLTIYNRWGQPVFERSSGSPSWNARDAGDGTYFYTFTYHSDCGAAVDQKVRGIITVLQ